MIELAAVYDRVVERCAGGVDALKLGAGRVGIVEHGVGEGCVLEIGLREVRECGV